VKKNRFGVGRLLGEQFDDVEHDQVDEGDEGAEQELIYFFRSVPTAPQAFWPMCVFHTTSLKSPFTRGWIVTRPLDGGGRITASRGLLMTTREGKMERRGIGSARELESLLANDFSMLPVGIPPTWFRRAK